MKHFFHVISCHLSFTLNESTRFSSLIYYVISLPPSIHPSIYLSQCTTRFRALFCRRKQPYYGHNAPSYRYTPSLLSDP